MKKRSCGLLEPLVIPHSPPSASTQLYTAPPSMAARVTFKKNKSHHVTRLLKSPMTFQHTENKIQNSALTRQHLASGNFSNLSSYHRFLIQHQISDGVSAVLRHSQHTPAFGLLHVLFRLLGMLCLSSQRGCLPHFNQFCAQILPPPCGLVWAPHLKW